MCGERIVALVDPVTARRMALAPNVSQVRRARGGRIFQIDLESHGDDTNLKARRGNPLAYVYDEEGPDNIATVWALKHIPTWERSIFRQVILDLSQAPHLP